MSSPSIMSGSDNSPSEFVWGEEGDRPHEGVYRVCAVATHVLRCACVGAALGTLVVPVVVPVVGALGGALLGGALGLRKGMRDEQARALWEASAKGDEESVGRLCGSGVHIDARDSRGRTALMYAVHAGHIRIVRRLLKSGADVDAADDGGNRPLTMAVE
ncbi:MAG: ankyrin repeat domain-containing protein, partial [Simkaniaceae bacterium]|nr:ankyrin repeat domain-containing protein [Simkaniaceae bacterium]